VQRKRRRAPPLTVLTLHGDRQLINYDRLDMLRYNYQGIVSSYLSSVGGMYDNSIWTSDIYVQAFPPESHLPLIRYAGGYVQKEK
jgi:hypothetical protein